MPYTINTTMKQKYDTYENFWSNNPILEKGVIAIAEKASGQELYCGDGRTHFRQLKPLGDTDANIDKIGILQNDTICMIEDTKQFAIRKIDKLNAECMCTIDELQKYIAKNDIKIHELETKQQVSYKHLPTYEDYISAFFPSFIEQKWSEPKFQCPECGGPVRRENDMCYASFPPKYYYQCDHCNFNTYLTE